MLILGLDVGGTKIEAALIEVSADKQADSFPLQQKFGNILARQRVATDRAAGYLEVLKRIVDLANQVCVDSNKTLSEIVAIGVGLPGTVHPVSQTMLNGNTAIFVEKNIVADLKEKLGDKKIVCANDANCFALAEVICGAGQSFSESCTGIGIILGTGVGGGVIINGKALVGKNGGAAELGHTQLYSSGHSCYCGQNGCVEQYLSGPALEANFHSKAVEKSSAQQIFVMESEENPFAKAVVKQYRRDLAKLLANLTNIFDPDFFVIGGGVSNQYSIYINLEETISNNTFVPQARPQVLKHTLGDSAGVIGAALHVLS